MFELEDIKKAHAKVKNGADFPAYIQDLIKLGVTKYDTYVRDGHTLYLGRNNCQIKSEPKFSELTVANTGDEKSFRHYLKIHQQGETDYPTFCRHSAETGVEKWTVDMATMTCTYYDKEMNKMLEEKIPTPQILNRPAANSGLALWRLDEHVLIVLFSARLQFRPKNNTSNRV